MTTRRIEASKVQIGDRRKIRDAIADLLHMDGGINDKRTTPHDYSSPKPKSILSIPLEPQPPSGAQISKNAYNIWQYDAGMVYSEKLKEKVPHFEMFKCPHKPDDLIVLEEEWWTERLEHETVWHIFDSPPKCEENLILGYGMTKHLPSTMPAELNQYKVLQVLGVENKLINEEYLDCILTEVIPEYKWHYEYLVEKCK